jgi:hypothetical protein
MTFWCETVAVSSEFALFFGILKFLSSSLAKIEISNCQVFEVMSNFSSLLHLTVLMSPKRTHMEYIRHRPSFASFFDKIFTVIVSFI